MCEKKCKNCKYSESLGENTVYCQRNGSACFGWDGGCDKYIPKTTEYEIKVGDEVLDSVASIIVTSINEDKTVNGFDEFGCTYINVRVKGKTGKNFPQITEIMKAMRVK